MKENDAFPQRLQRLRERRNKSGESKHPLLTAGYILPTPTWVVYFDAGRCNLRWYAPCHNSVVVDTYAVTTGEAASFVTVDQDSLVSTTITDQ